MLLVFTLDCAFCQRAWRSWATLIRSADKDGDRVAALDLADGFVSDDFLKLHNLLGRPLILAQGIDPHDVISYRLRWVPQTIIVGRQGR